MFKRDVKNKDVKGDERCERRKDDWKQRFEYKVVKS
jgi:hypothetical protein